MIVSPGIDGSTSISAHVRSTRAAASHVNSLDGVRAIAVLMVLVFHAGTPGFGAGWIGVDIFFALSGFLITTLLIREFETYGRISYGGFIARRALRLMPAYWLYAAFVTYGMWGWSGSVLETVRGWTPEAFNLALWGYAINFAPKGGVWNGQDITVHLWSLAVEQQYYLVWPLVVMLLAKRLRWLVGLGAVLTLLSLVSFLTADPGQYQREMLHTRGFSLLLASTVAVVVHLHWIKQQSSNVIQLMGLVAMLTATVLQATGLWSADRVMLFLLPVMSLGFAFWAAALWNGRGFGGGRGVLSQPVLVYVGKVSYGIYIFHEIIRVAVWQLKPFMIGLPLSLGFAIRLSLYLILSVGVAAVCYELYETRFLHLQRYFKRTLR